MTISQLAQSNANLDATTGLISRAPKTSMDQKDFLKLLTVQLTHQDPLSPQEDTAFVAQMASFTSLEQMNTLVDAFKQFNTGQDWSKTVNLVGQSVNLKHGEATISGTVEEASLADGIPMVRINGELYPFSEIFSVHTPTTPPATSGTGNP